MYATCIVCGAARGLRRRNDATTQHGLLDCWAATRGSLVRWRDEVLRELGDVHRQLELQGAKVGAARQVVDRARHCMLRSDTSDEGWTAVRQVVGGAHSPWEERPEPGVEQAVVDSIEHLQELFADRLEEMDRLHGSHWLQASGEMEAPRMACCGVWRYPTACTRVT